MRKLMAVRLNWSDKAKMNVCESCKRETMSCYIATGHDHTDECANMCDCGAGIPFSEFFEKVKNPSNSLEYYSKYL